jgi:hypothetical protein
MRPRSQGGALVLILVGVIFLLVNLGVLPVRDLARLLGTWWPLILIALGVWQLARPRKSE